MKRNKVDYLFINPSAGGNSCRYDYNLLSNLPMDNIGYISNVKYDAPEIKNVLFVPMFNYLGKSYVVKGFSYLFSLLKLFLFLCKYRPRLVHINWIRMPYVELHFYKVLRKLLHFRIVYTAHNILPHDSGDKYLDIYKKIYNMVDAVIVHSKYTKKELELLVENIQKIHVIRHGIIAKDQLLVEKPFDFRVKYNLKNKIIYSISGVQSSYKGTDLAIDAWISSPKLCNSDKACLVIMGKNSGVDYTNISKANNILLIDRYFTEEEHMSLFYATDVLLLPYRQISQSGVLLTALSFKVPAIVSNIGGLAETLEEANIGWVMEAINDKALRDIMENLYDHPDEIYRVKNNEKEWGKIIKYYSWEDIGNNTFRLYQTLM